MPHFVVVCGDLMHNIELGSAKQAEADYYINAQDEPCHNSYNVSSNHDIGNTPTLKISTVHSLGLWYSYTYRRNLFIVLESDSGPIKSLQPESQTAQLVE